MSSNHNKISSNSQLRFLAGNRTSDVHIILNNVIIPLTKIEFPVVLLIFLLHLTVPGDILFKKTTKTRNRRHV